MKKYYVVCDNAEEQIHKLVSGSAYIMVFAGTHKECAEWFAKHSVNANDIGAGH